MLWMDYPVAPVKHAQAANVAVLDTNGRPVSGATVIGEYRTPSGTRILNFPTTDDNGMSRLAIAMPAVTSMQTLTLTVTVVHDGEWDRAWTSFEVYP